MTVTSRYDPAAHPPLPAFPAPPNRYEATAQLRTILDGIDQTTASSLSGWWPTQAAAEFGADRLGHVIQLINELTVRDS